MNRAEIFDAIHVERERQSERWSGDHEWGAGDCSSNRVDLTTKAVVLGEEYGEVCRAILEQDNGQLATELVQLAAVCVAILEWIEYDGVACL